MRENLENTGGLPMAEAFVISLGKTKLGRQEAHELVRTITMDAEKRTLTCSEAIRENQIVKKYIDDTEIEKCLVPDNYTGHSEEIINKVLDSL